MTAVLSSLLYCWTDSITVWQMCYLWKGILHILKHWLFGSSDSKSLNQTEQNAKAKFIFPLLKYLQISEKKQKLL